MTFSSGVFRVAVLTAFSSVLSPNLVAIPVSPDRAANENASQVVTITPAKAVLHALRKQQFSANVPVNWSASCGAITTQGLFTAPATAGTCTITATTTTGTPGSGHASASVVLANYTSWKNGPGGAGAETDEYQLTPTNVSSGHFGVAWTAAVDEDVWAQPLYLNAITVGGKVRNVVFAATTNASVYAFDADTGVLLWKTSFQPKGATAFNGILSTPVIDSATGTLYAVAETSENSGTYFPHRLHALDVATGKEKFGGPVVISDPLLPPYYKRQRPALLLANGNIYAAFGSIGDHSPYHGLLFAFDKTTLAEKAVFNATPTGDGGGIWMSAAGLTADGQGNIYVSMGNGTFDGTTNFGEAVVKLSPNLQELDYFAPYNFKALNAGDVDLGSGDVLVVPQQNGPFPHELIVCGKPTPIYVLNGDALGHVGTTSDHIVQRLDHVLGATGNFRDAGQPCYTTPSIWKQNVYFAANHDVLKMFTLDPNTGLLSNAPVSSGPFIYDWPGSNPVISANGNWNGIVWTMDLVTGTLRANDANDVSKVLYVSPNLGTAIRWTVPTVINGHVYVGLRLQLVALSVH